MLGHRSPKAGACTVLIFTMAKQEYRADLQASDNFTFRASLLQ
jgi:hypothetical protein